MSPDDFIEYWRRSYGDTPLLGRVLRERFPQRWLRIHSLPDSKRYAETEEERREILFRQNGLFNELLGDGGPAELVFGFYGEEEHLADNVRAALRGLQPVFLTTLSPDQSGLDHAFPLMKASFAWKEKALDDILLAVADDLLETPLIVSVGRGCVLAPYDGGVDIIVESDRRRDQLEMRYSNWLPPHPEA